AYIVIPAAIVRGRCFVSGRDTGARPAESRRLALAVLHALAEQGQVHTAGENSAFETGYAYGADAARGESFASTSGHSPGAVHAVRAPKPSRFSGSSQAPGHAGPSESPEGFATT